jgi:hypothetical protein
LKLQDGCAQVGNLIGGDAEIDQLDPILTHFDCSLVTV